MEENSGHILLSDFNEIALGSNAAISYRLLNTVGGVIGLKF